jgi:hypothetical protein
MYILTRVTRRTHGTIFQICSVSIHVVYYSNTATPLSAYVACSTSRSNFNVTLRVAVSFCVLPCLVVMKDLVMSHNQLVLFLGRLATGWKVRGSNPGEGEIFRTRSDRPWGPPPSFTMDTGSFPGVKRPGRGLTSHLLLAPR